MNEIGSEQLAHYLDVYIIPWGIKLVMALLVFVIGRWVAKIIVRVLERLMGRAKLDSMLIRFLASIAYSALLVAVAIAALDQLGVNTTSLIAILGAAGLAIGLALKDSLSNFSAGVMIMIFRPFKVGDFIEAAGTSGIVEQIHIFNSVLRSGDNREIIVPNGKIFGDTIVNVTTRDTRRIDMVFGIGYDDDIKQARDLINAALAADERILDEPAPAISIAELADSSVNINVRPWVKTTDYWAVRSDLLENIKAAFDANDINIPYPQRDVHLYKVASSE